jgi:hypothetical protein
MSEDLQPRPAIDGRSPLPTRRNFLRGSGAVAAAGVTTLATGGLLGGTAKGATATAERTAPSSTPDARNAARRLQQTAQNAVIFGVPAVLIDMWSNSFAYIGLRATGDRAGAYAITAPGWSGKLPARVKRINATTKRVLALVRTFVKDLKDLKAAQKIHTSYTTGPLSRYPHGRIKPRIVPDATALNVFAPIDLTGSDISLYEEINSLINEYPPLPADVTHAKSLRSIGVDVKHYVRPSATLAPVLQAAIKPAIGQILADLPTLQTQIDGWGVNLHVTAITHNPLRRAALTIDGPGTHIAKEALYFGIGQVDGLPLTGAHNYTLAFPKGQLPPVGAFWSLILYDATTFFLVANPINRYEVASHTDGLIYGADGSLTIAVQHGRPNSPSVNWLPAPTGAFRLILRTYIPKPAIFDGAWTPPALRPTA